ncbi:MAG: hypothetical protein OEV93_00305 [Candidatus Moranbacteria bacterium]|nr:hypothetical protein [Candidatus Moranbacteria bacterium]
MSKIAAQVAKMLDLGLDFDPCAFHERAVATVHVLYTVEDEDVKRSFIEGMLLAEYHEQYRDDIDILYRKEVKAKRKTVEAVAFDGTTYKVVFVDFSPDDEFIWTEVYPPERVTWDARPVIPVTDYEWDRLQVGPSVDDEEERDEEEFRSSIRIFNGEGGDHVF